MEFDLITIIGPTASGKTHRAVQLAKCINAEIISGDSRQIYTGMDIGTGKDLCEYENVPVHLINIRPAGYKYNLHEFLTDFNNAYNQIKSRSNQVVFCGGTGLYVESALNGIILPEVPENHQLREQLKDKSLDELTQILKKYKTLHNTTDIDSVKRTIRAIEIQEYYKIHPSEKLLTQKNFTNKLKSLIIGIDIPRDARREKISIRLKSRINEGMIDEVKSLLDSGIAPDDLIYYGLEYKFVTKHLIGELTFEEMIKSLEIAIHQFAKRQMTWFRGMEKRGFNIHWIPYDISDQEFILEINKIKDSQQ